MFRGNSILGFHCLGGVTRPVIHLKMVVEILCLGSHTALQVVKKKETYMGEGLRLYST